MNNDILEDIICRFIINNPENFKNSYKLFFNLQSGYNFLENLKNTEITLSFKDFCYEALKLLNYKLDSFSSLYSQYIKKLNNIPVFGVIIVDANYENILLYKEKNNSLWNFPSLKKIENENIELYMSKFLNEDLGIDIHLDEKSEDYITTTHKKKILNKFLFHWSYNDVDNKNSIYQNKKEENLIKWENINEWIKNSQNNNLYENIKPLLNSIKENLYNKKLEMEKNIEETKDKKPKTKVKKEEYKYTKIKYMTSINWYLINFNSNLEDISKNWNNIEIFKNNEFNQHIRDNPLINFKI